MSTSVPDPTSPRFVRSRLRRPISRRRNVAGAIALAVLALPYAFYSFLTDDAYIRQQAARSLGDITDGEVLLGGASFSMFGGIRLNDVRILTPADAAFEKAGAEARDREIFSAGCVELWPDPWALLIGRLKIRRIVAVAPSFTLVYDADRDRYNSSLLFRRPHPPDRHHGPPMRPEATLRGARLCLVRLEAGRRHETPAYALDADAWPDAASDSAFNIDYRIYSDMPHRVRSLFDPRGRRVTDSPFVPYATVRQVLPSASVHFLDQFRVEGRCRVRRLDYGEVAEDQKRLRLEFRDVAVAVPIPLPEGGAGVPTSDSRWLPIRITEATGAIELAGTSVGVSLRGKVNGGPCQIEGTMQRRDLPLTQLGMDLSIDCSHLTLPEGQDRKILSSDSTVPGAIRAFFCDFDPHGTVAMRFRLTRPPGPEGPFALRGELTPLGADAAYRGFSYRLSDLRGVVRFADDGIHFDQVAGRHGAATVRIGGVIDSPELWTGLHLTFAGEDVWLDDDLFRPLAGNFQELWRYFQPSGRTRTTVRLRRAHGSREAGASPWETSVDVELLGTTATVASFPYPISKLHGRVEIDPHRIEFQGIQGEHGDARIRLDGWASHDNPKRTDAEIRLDATGIPLDDAFRAALPGGMRRALAGVANAGHIDVAGRVYQRGGGEMQYELNAAVRDVTVQHESFRLPVDHVRGELQITPREVVFRDFRGRRGEGTIVASGRVDVTENGHDAAVTLAGQNVALDAALRDALPDDLRRTWAMFQPSGRLAFSANIRDQRRDERVTRHQRIEIQIADGRLKYAPLPIPLEHVNTRMLWSDRRVEILDFGGELVLEQEGGGRAEGPRPHVRLGGSVELEEETAQGGLQLLATSIPLDHPQVVAALPDSIRAAWEHTRVKGLADLRIDRLLLTSDAEGHRVWDADGTVELRNCGLNVGVRFEKVAGSLRGTARLIDGKPNAMQLDAVMNAMEVEGLPLTDVKGRMVLAPNRGALRFEDMLGHAFGGNLSGFGQVDFEATRPTYALSLAVADADLAEYLKTNAARRRAINSPVRGRIVGSLSLSGVAGDAGSREGSGEVFLKEAQVWKLPLFLSVLQLLDKTPDEGAFHDARVQYYLVGDMLRLARVDLQGQTLTLIGTGQYDLHQDALDLTLVSGTPNKLRVPLLTELVEGASRELMEIRVRGRLSHPVITAQPLKSVRGFLDLILGAGPVERNASPPPRRRP